MNTPTPDSLGAASCSASLEAVQYADYILNHYSRDSHADKLCLARDLERHGWRLIDRQKTLMETLIENSLAPSVDVPRLVRLRCWLRNLRHWKTGRAIRDLERAFWTDDGFVLTWKCHIAMTLIDRCGLPHDKANECADELMRALFGCKPNSKDHPTKP